MPTYSYKCTECGTAFDIQQAFTDDSLTECPNCGGKLRKLFSAVGVSFNGSGFYRNDSRSSGRSDAPKSDSSSGSSSSGSSSGSGSSGDGGSSSGGSSGSQASSSAPQSKPAASSPPAA